MPGEWRSSAAQVFVGGRIAKIEEYWRSTALSAEIFYMIDEWELWDDAFGGSAKRVKKDWRRYRQGPDLATGLAMKAGSFLHIGPKPRALGTELFDGLEHEVIRPLQQLLHDTALTVNFNAAGWFGSQAGFDEYVTMWDRKKTDASLNVNPDPKNPAHVRAKADRWALYGQFGKSEALASGVNLPHVKRQGGVTAPPAWNYATTKPAATDSQVFAALNYGRRAHGSNTEYGQSFFELDDGYKTDAIFFAMDTFTAVSTGTGYKTKDQRSKLYQVSANAFGGAILLAIKSQYEENKSATHLQNSIALVKDLLSSARQRTPKPDNKDNHLFIEAHLFQRVRMTAASVKGVYVSNGELAGHPSGRSNITAFAARTGIPVSYTP